MPWNSVTREQRGQILGTLVKEFQDLDLAEEGLQEAWEEAVRIWPARGTPSRPVGWLIVVAKRRILDVLRRRKVLERKQEQWYREHGPDTAFRDPEAEAYPDGRLMMLFTSCHPALAMEARVALMLKTVAGMSVAEIASAFLVPEDTMYQRLVRAKKKIRASGIPFRIPPADLVPERLDEVLAAIYLVFNQGSFSSGEDLVAEDLCAEALFLARMLVTLLEQEGLAEALPEARGLVALILLTKARTPARVSAEGQIVLLEDQDRTLWNRTEVEEGLALLHQAQASPPWGPYVLQAALSAVHDQAPTWQATDWNRIVALYTQLLRLTPSPVIRLNQALAVSYAQGPADAWDLLVTHNLEEALVDYLPFHLAQADLHQRLGRIDEARRAYQRALGLASNPKVTEYLTTRLQGLG